MPLGSQWMSTPKIFEAPITFNEFRALAWEAANEKARHLGWVKSCAELHEAVKRAGHGPCVGLGADHSSRLINP